MNEQEKLEVLKRIGKMPNDDSIGVGQLRRKFLDSLR